MSEKHPHFLFTQVVRDAFTVMAPGRSSQPTSLLDPLSAFAGPFASIPYRNLRVATAPSLVRSFDSFPFSLGLNASREKLCQV